MRLIGIFPFSFVRRVAVSLKILELPFELEEVFVFGEPEVVRRYNPLLAVFRYWWLTTVKMLSSSGAILDEIDHMVSPERRLTPSDGPLRRRCSALLRCSRR